MTADRVLAAAAIADPVLAVAGLAADRGGRRVFAGISFNLAAGGAVQVEGPNGAGKSTLLRVLAELLPPAEGRVDNPFTLAYAGHDVALKPGSSLAAELAHWARLDGAHAATVAAAAERFALTALLDLPTAILSSGQRRRAALARVAASGAELWLLDEPDAGLDAASREHLAAAIADHRANGGLVVAVTHSDLGIVAPQMVQM